MFCCKCGKRINYAAVICNECLQGGAQLGGKALGEAGKRENFYTDFNVVENANENTNENTNENVNEVIAEPVAEQSAEPSVIDTPDNAPLVVESETELNVVADKAVDVKAPQQTKPKASKMAGFVNALLSTIFGAYGNEFVTFGSFVGFLASIMIMGGDGSPESTETTVILLVFTVGSLLPGIILSVIALINTIKAIKIFKSSQPRPVVTVILGLNGLRFFVASVLFMSLIAYTIALLGFIMSFA